MLVYIQNNLTDWFHIAICRNSGITKIFINGVEQESVEDTRNYICNEIDMIIGNEQIISDQTSFHGILYGFQIIKGVALYTSDFTPSTPVQQDETSLLLFGDLLYSTEGEIGNVEVLTTNEIPQSSPPPVEPSPLHITSSRNGRSLFSNNAMVFYKSKSLTSVPFGSVRNSRHIRYKT